jgi:hypothetical protein
VIRLWERKQFKFSFEYIIASLIQRSMVGKNRAKSEKADRMNIREILYNPEPIMFIPKTK